MTRVWLEMQMATLAAYAARKPSEFSFYVLSILLLSILSLSSNIITAYLFWDLKGGCENNILGALLRALMAREDEYPSNLIYTLFFILCSMLLDAMSIYFVWKLLKAISEENVSDYASLLIK